MDTSVPFQKSVENLWVSTRTNCRLENWSHVLLLSSSHGKLGIQQLRHLLKGQKKKLPWISALAKGPRRLTTGCSEQTLLPALSRAQEHVWCQESLGEVRWGEGEYRLLIPEAAIATISRTVRTIKLAFQAPILALYPFWSLPPILPSSSGNSQAGLACALFFYSLKYSAEFYICYWETLRLVLIFPSTAALLSTGIHGDGSSL